MTYVFDFNIHYCCIYIHAAHCCTYCEYKYVEGRY